jgi:hypothetical protein
MRFLRRTRQSELGGWEEMAVVAAAAVEAEALPPVRKNFYLHTVFLLVVIYQIAFAPFSTYISLDAKSGTLVDRMANHSAPTSDWEL